MASKGSAAVFQQRARRTSLETEQEKVVVRKGDCGLPGLKVYGICCQSNCGNPVSFKQIPGFFPSTI